VKSRTIKVGALARVEGEGALYVKIQGNRVAEVKLRIFEPPRFFEAFLRGRSFSEAPDLTARICGICPVAYQMSACQAMEDAFGVSVDGPLRLLRRLIYCGEWIESHALHVYLLHAPDFLGYQDTLRMAQDQRGIVERGLRLKKAGNAIMALIGGREVHPINVRVGGFYRVPTRKELSALMPELEWARQAALSTVRWVAAFDFPDFEPDYEFVSLRHPEQYPFNEGRLASNRGLDIPVRDFDRHFVEEQVAHSNALHCRLRERGAYLTGALARYNLNFDLLSPVAKEAALSAGLSRICRNPFQSIIVRSVEILYAVDEALRLIGEYEPPDRPAVVIEPRAGTGYGCTEAPRGSLYHRYLIDEAGLIQDARIVPPTAQNQKMMEADLRELLPRYPAMGQNKLTELSERAIRNHDPCISCATHFLRVEVEQASDRG